MTSLLLSPPESSGHPHQVALFSPTPQGTTNMMGVPNHNQPSNMVHQFSQVPQAEIQRSQFDRSHSHKTAFDSSYLVPVLIDEALPGDTFKLDVTFFARLATPIVPVMDNMYLDSHFFSIPMRLVFNNWQRMMGEQENPDDTTDFTIPQMTSPAGGYAIGSLEDHMGLPTGIAGLSHSCLWHRAYNLLWNQWYRDQNLQDSVTVKKDDGPDSPSLYTLLKRGKRHDYFTSCLPWPQKGPGVEIPLGNTAPIIRGQGTSTDIAYLAGSGNLAPAGTMAVNASGQVTGTGAAPLYLVPGANTLVADLSQATAATINSLRQAFQLQKMFERDARGGTRYIELLKAHFGVTSPDARLQRVEYLGGGSTPVNLQAVPQTSPTGAYATTPQGNLAGIGTLLAHNHGFTHSFTEHCLIIGLVSVRADLSYQQGMQRMWSRKTRFDFYWPALAHIGEQAVLQKEIYATGNPVEDDKVFGYQERFAEYRYAPSLITGLFRSQAAQSLDIWHLAQDFATAPVLDDAFITENPPIDRVIAVPSEPQFLMDAYFRMNCSRPMPLYGTPGLIDHF
ncbi:MAG: major capsid protein [Microvirus sp.]|nr:MAG: major capsid protein [Microvirus sp.]